MMYVVSGKSTVVYDNDWLVYEFGDMQNIPTSLGKPKTDQVSPLGKAVQLNNEHFIAQTA